MSQKEISLPEPGPTIRKNLLNRSEADTYEDAREEWDLEDYQPYGKQTNCDLCHQENLKRNYVLKNINNGNTMVVGSRCIERFLILAGTKDQEGTLQRLRLKEKEIGKEIRVRELYREVLLVVPIREMLIEFRKCLVEILDIRGLRHLMESRSEEDTRRIIQQVILIEDPPEDEVRRIDDILHRFQLIRNLAVSTRKPKKEKQIKEGQTWQKRGKVTGTTLSSSEAYRPDRRLK